MTSPLARTAPSAEARAAVDDLRLEAIEEAADLAIPFLVGVRQAARDGDVTRLGECLQAVRLASVVMLQAFGELGDPEAAP
jgi:hypothetical protein